MMAAKAIAILIDMVISPRVGMQISSADLDWPETVFIPCFAASCHFTQTTSPLCDRALRGDKGDGVLSVFESKEFIGNVGASTRAQAIKDSSRSGEQR
jgi:hypothetical protein